MPGGNTFKDTLILVVDADHSKALERIEDLRKELEYLSSGQNAHVTATNDVVAASNKEDKAKDKVAKTNKKVAKSGKEVESSLMSQSHSFRKLSGNLSTGSVALDVFSLKLDRASMFMWRFNIAMMPLQQIGFQLAAVAIAMGGLEKASIEAFRSADRMRNTFMGMGDSAVDAADKVDYLLEKAKMLPFTFTQVSGAAMAFRTSGIAQTTEELDKWLNSAANLAAAATTEEGRDISRAAEAMVDAVNGQIRRLRDTYHISGEEIKKYGDDTSTALHRLIDDKWGGTAEMQMQSLEGSISNFIDSLTRLGIAFGENLKDPLMLFLGIGQDVVDTLTSLVKMTDNLGGGWVALGVTAIPVIGFLSASVARLYMQYMGLKGAYMIMTRNVDSLFTVIARLTAAMNELAVAEANELANMEGSQLAIKEQIAERNRLIATIEAQGAAHGKVEGAIMAHKYGMDMDVASTWHSESMRGVSRMGGGGRYWQPHSQAIESLDIAKVSRRTNIPEKLYEETLHKQGRLLGELTQAEHIFMLEETKRLGISTASAAATIGAADAEAALLATRKAQITVAAEEMLLRQRQQKLSISSMLGYAGGGAKGAGGWLKSLGSQEAWNARFEVMGTGLRKVRLAMATTTGALIAGSLAIMGIYGSVMKIRQAFIDAEKAIEASADAEESRIDALVEAGQLRAEDAAALKNTVALAEEELKHKDRLWKLISAYQELGLIAFGIPTLIGAIAKKFSNLQGEMRALESEMDQASSLGLVRNTERAFQVEGGQQRATRTTAGRTVTREEAMAAAARLQPSASGTSPMQRDINSVEAKIEEIRARESKENKLSMDDKKLLNELMVEQQKLLVEEAEARRIIAVTMGNEEKMRTAEEDRLRAVNKQREIEIDLLSTEQNAIDSEIGYLRATHAEDAKVAIALMDKMRAHEALAEKYKESGDMAQYYQNKTAAQQAYEEAVMAPIENNIKAMEREEQMQVASGASAEELFEIRMREAEAIKQQAFLLNELGMKEEAEQKQVEALKKEHEALNAVLQEAIDKSSGYIAFMEAAHQKAGPLADEYGRLASAYNAMAQAAIEAGDVNGYWSARTAAVQATEKSRLLPAQEGLQDAQNVLDARRELGASTELINDGIAEENKALAELAIQYRNVGDEQAVWETSIKILRNEQDMAINTHENAIKVLDREYELLEANNGSAEELRNARNRQADAIDDYADSLKKLGRVEDAEEKKHKAKLKRLEAERDYYRDIASEMDAYAARAEIFSSRDDNLLLDPRVYSMKLRAAQAELRAAHAYGKKSDVLNAENKIYQLRRDREKQLEDARQKALDDYAAKERSIADRYGIFAGGNADTSSSVFNARMAALEAEKAALDKDDVAGLLDIQNKMYELIKKTSEARDDEATATAQARYELAKELEDQGLVSKGYVSFYKQQLISVLKQRIEDETVISEKIRLQTDLIKLQAEEAGDAYDSIVKRILGGNMAVEDAITESMLLSRFGPKDFRPSGGMNTSDAIRLVGSDRNTLTIEIGNGSVNRLRSAIGNAGSEAFTTAFIETLVERLNS